MSCLRSLEILKEIYTLFQDNAPERWYCFDKQEYTEVMVLIGMNMDGTVTVEIPCKDQGYVYITFDGTGIVEIWNR